MSISSRAAAAVTTPPPFRPARANRLGRVVLFQRDPDKPRLTVFQKRAARRVKELSRIYHDQFPKGLPHNGQGVNYAKYICRTMAFLPNDRRAQWLDQHAAWISPETRDYNRLKPTAIILRDVHDNSCSHANALSFVSHSARQRPLFR